MALQEVSVTALGDKVYVVGGSSSQTRVNTMYVFDPASPGWVARAPYPGTSRDHIGIAATGGMLYLLGGVAAWPSPSVATVQRYNPATNSWTAVAPLPVARGAMAVAALNNKIYAAGGLVSGSAVRDFTVYDPATNTWQTLPPMPTPRDHAVGVALNGQFYVTGGRTFDTCSPLRTVEVFDPVTGQWRNAPPMQNARGGHGAAAVNGKLYVFGGEGAPANCAAIPSTEEYDPSTNTWTDAPPMPTPRHGTGGAVIGTTIYVPGGGTAPGDAPTSVVEKFSTGASQAPPAPWVSSDIGAVGLAGSASHSSGAFTVRGAGADIWGTEDSFHFLHQSVAGDTQIVTRVTGIQNTHPFAKAGVMLRGSLAPTAPHVFLGIKPDGGIEFMTRSTAGETTFLSGVSGVSLPVWLRLVRSGAQVSASWSADGAAWSAIGTTGTTLPASAYAGLSALSHDPAVLNTASFDNVGVTAGVANPPPTVTMTAPANGATFATATTVTLAATASDSNGTVTSVQFLANGTSVGTDTTSPYSVSWNGPASGSYTLTAIATDSGGAQAQSAPLTITVGTPTSQLPSPWSSTDIGNPGLAGSAGHANGVFTVKGAGADIWGGQDSFHFVHQTTTGDMELVARVASLQNTNPGAKAGVMVRGSLAVDAPHVILALRPDGGIEFMTRSTAGGTTAYLNGPSGISAPVWLRLARSGAQVTASWSTNGTTWTGIGTTATTLPASVYAGLPVLSHDTAVLNTATFDNVSLTAGTTTNPPPNVAITAPASGATFVAPTSVTLTATASDTNGTVTSVQFLANGASLGTDTTSPYSIVWSGPGPGTYTLTAVATDSGGAQTQSAPVSITVSTSSSQLPAPWTSVDIGWVGVAGTATHSTGVFTVKGAGEDISGGVDGFHFAYRQVNGDQDIIARVASLQNTHPNAKAGVMFRESLAANARHATMSLTPAAEPAFMRRLIDGAPITSTSGDANAATSWVRLIRQGHAFSGYTSPDGKVWQRVGTETIPMGSNIYVGLAVTSHNTSALATSTFDSVSVGAPPDTAPLPPIAPASLTDTFDDNQRDTAKWFRGALTYNGYNADEDGDYHPASDMLVRTLEQNGRLEIFPRADAAGLRFNGYGSVQTFDFTRKHASVHVVQAPNPSGTADLVFSVVADHHHWYRFHVVSGSLLLEKSDHGATTATTISYNPTQHKFFRLRHDEATGAIVWETSPDRSAWVVQRTATLAHNPVSVRIELAGGTHQRESQPGAIMFDSFRLEPNVPVGANKPPIADAGGPYTGVAGQPVQFSAGASYDPDGTIAQYLWNFGDGSTATGATVTHTYPSAGVFHAVLKVTDNSGATTSASAKTSQITPALVGQWSRPIDMPVVGVHVHLLPTGKVLLWQHESTSVPYLWDPVANNGVFEAVPIHSNQGGTRRDSIYCSGHSFLPDGRLFVTGGHIEPNGDTVLGSPLTNIFDPAQNRWSSGPNMTDGRWYPTNLTLGDGSTLVLSGSIDDNFADTGVEGYVYRVNELPEIYGTNGQFRSLPGALLKHPLYPMVHLAPNGKAFVAGPEQTTRFLDTSGTGAWTVVGNSNFGTRIYGTSVMYEPGRILLIGGSQDTPTNTVEAIDLNASAPSWRYVSSTAINRTRVSGTVLPDGKVLIGGGHSTSGFSPGAGAIMTAELWDPATGRWSKMADAAVARLHHSGALLLPDARVLFLGGGQPTGEGDYDHYDAEIYSPPYLFKGARPTITAAPAVVGYGQTFAVTTPDATNVSQVTWIRLPSVTHHFNQNQGINRLSFTKTATGLTVTTPTSGTLAPPGPYMLFILNDSGVPSVAKIVTLGNVAAPAAPSNLATVASSANQINVSWTDGSSTEAGFKLERCQGAGCTNFSELAQVAANVVSYSDSAVNSGLTYSYRLRAFNAGGDSPYSNTATVTTPLAAPSNLTAIARSSTRVGLSWTATSTAAQGFRIERCLGISCVNFVQIAQTVGTATVYDDTGLTAGTSYTYRVRAYADGATSAYSNSVSVTATGAVPTAPASLSAAAVASTQINLTWVDASSDENGFRIERCVGAACVDFVQVAQVGLNVSAYSDMGLASGTAYSYRVRSFNGNGGSAYSNTAQAVTPDTPPAPPIPPGTLTATPVSSSQITLTWEDASSDESGFKIERCAAAGCTNFVQISQTAANVATFSDSALLGGTSYSYRVRGYNAGGDSAPSNTATASTPAASPTPPAAPASLAAAPVSSSQIDLAWTDTSTNETGFKVERCTGSGCTAFIEIAQPGANATTYSDAGRAADTTYTYRVRAYNAGGNSAYAGPVEASTLASQVAPAVPSDLSLSVVSTTQIDLVWTDNSSNETSFKIERCKGVGCTDFVQIAEVTNNVTAYASTNLQVASSYSYRVRAQGPGGASGYSNVATASTQAAPPDTPVAPGSLAAQVTSASRINLTWTDNSSNEAGFLVESCLGSGCISFTEIAQTPAGVVTFAASGLLANTTYSFRVRAYNAQGHSGYTNTTEATTQAAPSVPPAAPTDLASRAVSSTQVDLTWIDMANNENSFRIERCGGAACTNFTEVGQVAANVQRYSDTGVVGSTTYSYRVRAVNDGGNSAYSNSSESTTPPAPPPAPTALTATAVSSTQVNLAWTDDGSNETGFRIERCEGAGCTAFIEIAQTAANVTTYSDPGRAVSTPYSYRVRAYNVGGVSSYSNTATATTSGVTPAAPTTLVGTATTSRRIDLQWADQAGDETGFRVERSTNGTTFMEVAVVSAGVTIYRNNGLTPGTLYYYRVRAYNAVGNSAYSNVVQVRTQAK